MTGIGATDFPHDLAARWAIVSADLLVDTRTSRVFRVVRRDGSLAIAKLLKPEGLHELPGFDFLTWRNGAGAVQLIEMAGTACLLEDAGVLTLREWRLSMGDVAASHVIADIVGQLHSACKAEVPSGLLPLRHHFRALFLQAGADAMALAEPLRWCADIVESLLQNQCGIRPLHGDLHHENIISGGGRGWLAIDPQGLLGDPAYEVANVFGNPDGAFPDIIEPARIAMLVRLFAPLIGCGEEKILRYAIAHAGLSISWALENGDPLSDGSDAFERRAFLDAAKRLLEEKVFSS
ncbi:aminoglycoside phosphotransferase family protein [Neorhizobium lilium]|uniref:aminoglycoside phosphotransferase family protein n=1 Tax=Neorhizobium lilium TaxID=2503024 RepID=UPI0013E37628|nr:aminoglycoside phosphotransferase family protein [Neorhizobium lilium]